MSTARVSGHFLFAVAVMPLLVGGACEKKTTTKTDPGAVVAMDRADSAKGPVDTAPLNGIDVSKLDAEKQKLFYGLVGSLNSPCGKGESLRKSFTSDTACRRAPFAVRLVLAMVEDEFPDDVIRKQYVAKYEAKEAPVKIDVSKAPRIGNNDAPVRLVEFFDYGCPHCREFLPMLEQVAAAHEKDLVEYFLMYPLGNWPDSKSAAQAALAANAQGKFKQMHETLFAHQPVHGHEAVSGYAKEIGLDMAKFEADYQALGAQVELDHAQGQSVKVVSTPTVYFNDRKYEGMMNPKYIGMWIDEEVAVNR